ncbi:hypothetical protein ACFVWX_10215 [Streptomyces sp. NPDC058220]|uniref:hypothetical protein n=1 Tax=Streptomyces sp. NPDC058220 TaxID=3346387 RepID=UPI0036E058A4
MRVNRTGSTPRSPIRSRFGAKISVYLTAAAAATRDRSAATPPSGPGTGSEPWPRSCPALSLSRGATVGWPTNSSARLEELEVRRPRDPIAYVGSAD